MPQAKSKTAKKKTAKKAAKKKVSAKKTAAPKAKKKSSTSAKKADTDFTVGDYVVYPMHGVGEISAVQNQNILGIKAWSSIEINEYSEIRNNGYWNRRW